MSLTILKVCFLTTPKNTVIVSNTNSITSEYQTSFSLFLEPPKICFDLPYPFTYILCMSPMTVYMLMLLSKFLNTLGKILSEIQRIQNAKKVL